MIRRALVAALAACAVLSASDIDAQTIGFKLGASFADWSVDSQGVDLDSENVTSFLGGGFVRFGLGRLALQPELMVVTRGAEFSGTGYDGIGEFKLDYVEVPVLLVLPLTTGTGAAPYVFGGPSFAFEIKCQADGDDCDDNVAGVFDRKSLDLGLTAGAGLQFPAGPGALLVEGRYNFGLGNISDLEGLEVKSRTAAILAGYSIPIGAPRY